MKLTSFNFTIELSKDENGYSNNYYVDVTDKGVSISHPYVTQTPEQVMFVTNLIHDFIGIAIGLNARVDGFNRDNHLEEYAPQVSSTEVSEEESTEVSAAPQTCALGDEEVSTGTFKDSEHPFGLSEEQIKVLKANKGEEEVEIKDAPFEEDKLAILKTALESDEPLKEESKELEVIVGADRDIDKPKSTIVITKVTEEDNW